MRSLAAAAEVDALGEDDIVSSQEGGVYALASSAPARWASRR